MKLLANENFPLKSFLYLKNKAFDIKSIALDSPGISDNEVMKIAINEGRTIITFDRDYGELIFKHDHKPANGVIYLRITEYNAEEPGHIIEEISKRNDLDFNSALTVVDKNSIRQRKY